MIFEKGILQFGSLAATVEKKKASSEIWCAVPSERKRRHDAALHATSEVTPTMKNTFKTIAIATCLFCSASLTTAQAQLRQITIEKFGNEIAASEVSVIALMDDFRPGSRSSVPGNNTPSGMLQKFLASPLSLASKDSRIRVAFINCPAAPGEPRMTRLHATAEAIHEAFHYKQAVDKSYPKIFLFHKGRLIENWSYFKNPGIEQNNRISQMIRALLP